MNVFVAQGRGQRPMLIAGATAVVAFFAVSALSQSSTVVPEDLVDQVRLLEPDRPVDCSQLAPDEPRWRQLRVELADGAEQRHQLGSASLAVQADADAEQVRWNADQGIAAVIIEGSKTSLMRRFVSARFDASHYTESVGQLQAITFCYALDLSVNVDANPAYTRRHEWTITEAAQPQYLQLQPGATGEVVFRLSARKKRVDDTGWRASGTITIDNLTPVDATIDSVNLASDSPASTRIDCGLAPSGHVLASGETLSCTYLSAFADGTPKKVHARVTTRGEVRGSSATARIRFDNARVEELADSIAVTDGRGHQWVFDESGSSVYQRTFECDRDDGIFSSTARIVGGEQAATTRVVVDCQPGSDDPTTARHK